MDTIRTISRPAGLGVHPDDLEFLRLRQVSQELRLATEEAADNRRAVTAEPKVKSLLTQLSLF